VNKINIFAAERMHALISYVGGTKGEARETGAQGYRKRGAINRIKGS